MALNKKQVLGSKYDDQSKHSICVMKTEAASPLPTKEQYLAAIAKIERLSPAPIVLSKALKLLRDINSDLESITALIKNDPALTGTILRVANSVFFGAGVRVSSLDHAVQKIGFRETVHLLNISVGHTLSARDLGSYGIAAQDYWAESLANGLFMEHLARYTGGADPDEAHTVGLLRYIGRLAINEAIHTLGGGLFWDETIPLEQWESENVGFTQTHAATVLLSEWKFPPNLVQAIEYQNTPQLATPPSWLAEALNFTSLIVSKEGNSCQVFLSGKTPLSEVPDHLFIKRHALDIDALNQLADETRRSFASVQKTLRT